MRIRVTLLTSLAHSGDVHVATETPVVPATQVRTPGVVLLSSSILHPSRLTRQLLRARVAPLPLVPLDLFLRLSLKISLPFNLLLARLLVLLVFLLVLWHLRLPYQFLLLFSIVLLPLLQLTRRTNLGSLRLISQML